MARTVLLRKIHPIAYKHHFDFVVSIHQLCPPVFIMVPEFHKCFSRFPSLLNPLQAAKAFDLATAYCFQWSVARELVFLPIAFGFKQIGLLWVKLIPHSNISPHNCTEFDHKLISKTALQSGAQILRFTFVIRPLIGCIL